MSTSFPVVGVGNLLRFGRVMSGCTGSLGTLGAPALAPGSLVADGLGYFCHLCLIRGGRLVPLEFSPVARARVRAGTLVGRRSALLGLGFVLDGGGLRAAVFRLVRLGSRLLLAMHALFRCWPGGRGRWMMLTLLGHRTMLALLGLGIIGPRRDRADQEKAAHR
ncbi:MAG: hypothetical protein ACP5XB_10780 [Isosphaeraceae bacterium]